jgi:hypothetical protein
MKRKMFDQIDGMRKAIRVELGVQSPTSSSIETSPVFELPSALALQDSLTR